MAKFKFWIVINVYALLLDVLSVIIFCASFKMYSKGFVFCLLLATMGTFLLYGAIGIHGTYSEKSRIYSILLRKNHRHYRRESFKDFVSVPCHRVLVRMVLRRLRRSEEYAVIKKMYYRYPWQRELTTETVLKIFNTKEEGDLWLLQQKSKTA